MVDSSKEIKCYESFSESFLLLGTGTV